MYLTGYVKNILNKSSEYFCNHEKAAIFKARHLRKAHYDVAITTTRR